MKTHDPELTNQESEEESSDEELLPSLAQRLAKMKLKNEPKILKSISNDNDIDPLNGSEKKIVTENIVKDIANALNDSSANGINASIPLTKDSKASIDLEECQTKLSRSSDRQTETVDPLETHLEERPAIDSSDSNEDAFENDDENTDSLVFDDEISKVLSQGTSYKNVKSDGCWDGKNDFSFGVQFEDSVIDSLSKEEFTQFDSAGSISNISKEKNASLQKGDLPENQDPTFTNNEEVKKLAAEREGIEGYFEEDINYNEENFSSTPCVRKHFSKSQHLDNEKLNHGKADSLLEAFESQTDTDSLLQLLESDDIEKKQAGEGCDNICTPPCLDLSTPDIATSPLLGEPKSCLKEITNFSHLGDSILVEDVLSTPLLSNKETQRCHSNKENDVIDYEKALRRKLNLSENVASEENSTDLNDQYSDGCDKKPSVMSSRKQILCDDSIDIESTGSPLSLADRLKLKLRKQR